MGVVKIAIKVEIEVIKTDKAVFPLDRCTAKLDTFPPGQAAIKTIPKAMDGGTANRKVKPKVNIGNKINWEMRPIIGGLGDWSNCSKSFIFISKATPNIKNPKQKFNSINWSGLKFILKASMFSIIFR